MILMCSRGGSTAKKYAILTAQLGGPSPRQLRCVLCIICCSDLLQTHSAGPQHYNRALVANSEDALWDPYLSWDNMLQLAHLIKAMKFSGAITVTADCTKVRAHLTYSTDFGSHILGSTLPLDECAVEETEDIDEVIGHIKKKKAIASQTRAIITKVISHSPLCILIV